MTATTFPGDQEEIDSGTPPRRGPDRLGAVSKILGAILASLLILGIALTGTAWVAAQFVENDLEALEDALGARIRSIEESFAEQLGRVEDDLDSRINGISDQLARVETQITSIDDAVQEILRRLDRRVQVSVRPLAKIN